MMCYGGEYGVPSNELPCQTVLVPFPAEQHPSKSKGLRPAIDAEQVQQQWLSQFEDLEDPRGLQGQEHVSALY